MRKITLLLALILMLGFTSCVDKIQAAKTTLAFVSLAVQTGETGFSVWAQAKKKECLKLGAEGSEAFAKCYATTAKAVEIVDKLKPQIAEAIALSAAAIKAAEQKQSGQAADYVTPIKKTVCLATKLATWLPTDWKKKMEAFLALAAAYACDNPSATRLTVIDLYVLQQARALLHQLNS